MKLFPEDNTAVVVAFYEAFSHAELDAFDVILSPSWVNHPADPGHESTPEGFSKGVLDFHTAFEDFHITRDALVAQGDFVVCRITMTGRHVGRLGNWLPDGKLKTFYGMDMHRLKYGRIEETWHFERMGND
ncbi:ester cyclase [Salmonella enterica]|uniref:ester cyclase n=1 Tax=Salmonella enterica TaxID=28901 RepID=UPI000A02A4FA|nr:ester cyclase [Salmonella enterica]EKI9308947.1 ester cyclase [Escherichia coli]ORG30301.1 hypothetical protein B5Z55_06975 [Salmonella enterica subsp. enterica serovar Typhimurium]HCN7989341.1 ester cyclase [Escherichia coli]HDK6359856.1 ester cyclase [Klebsiella variicola]